MLTTTPEIGEGLYIPSEISRILQIPAFKVRRWINSYWDGELSQNTRKKYSWKTDNSLAVNFYTLVEFYVMIQFQDSGVKTRQILNAHKELSEKFNTPFPFAIKEVLGSIKTDGKKIYLHYNDGTLTLDGTKQFNLEFIKVFFKKLEFDSKNLVSRFWPMGKELSILIDPNRKFGHPVIDDSNIYPEAIHNHYSAGDPISYIAAVYDLSEKQVRDAIKYCEAA